jgi:hypothetical protein
VPRAVRCPRGFLRLLPGLPPYAGTSGVVFCSIQPKPLTTISVTAAAATSRAPGPGRTIGERAVSAVFAAEASTWRRAERTVLWPLPWGSEGGTGGGRRRELRGEHYWPHCPDVRRCVLLAALRGRLCDRRGSSPTLLLSNIVGSSTGLFEAPYGLCIHRLKWSPASLPLGAVAKLPARSGHHWVHTFACKSSECGWNARSATKAYTPVAGGRCLPTVADG